MSNELAEPPATGGSGHRIGYDLAPNAAEQSISRTMFARLGCGESYIDLWDGVDRTQLEKLLQRLTAKDVVVVPQLAVFGHSVARVLEILRYLSDLDVTVHSLEDDLKIAPKDPLLTAVDRANRRLDPTVRSQTRVHAAVRAVKGDGDLNAMVMDGRIGRLSNS